MQRNQSTAPSSRQMRSLLSASSRRLLTVALALAVFMLGNTLYLLVNRVADAADLTFFAAGKTSLPKLFQLMVWGHTWVGLLMTAVFVVFSVWHLPAVWKRRRNRTIASGVLLAAGGLALAGTGLFIMTAAASRQHGWIWWTHVLVAVAVPAVYVIHRQVSFVRPVARGYRRSAVVTAALAGALVVGHGLTNREVVLTAEATAARARGLSTGPGGRERDIARFVPASFKPAGFVPPQSPFFPAATTTTTGDYLPSRIITRGELGSPDTLLPDLRSYGFVVNTEIGAESCARCHADIVEQWSKSAHRFASFNNPFYEATVNDLRANATAPNEWVAAHLEAFPEAAGREGMIKSKWCSGCHDPALMLAGKMHQPIDRDSPQAQAGLTCLACHAIDRIHNVTGNGNYNIADEQEDPYLFADAADGVRAYVHDSVLKAKPEVHKRQLLQPFFRTAEYCAACHKVSLNVPVNNYRWLRGQDEYDAWHDSGVARNASRTFYLPPEARVCQDCHMPPEPIVLGDVSARNGTVRSHRFLAVNTALPFVRGDDETIRRIEAFLRADKLQVDVFALHPADHDGTVMALDRSAPTLAPGQDVTLDVVVRNLGVGHTFPGGTNDSNEGWLELTVTDDEGVELFGSGGIQENGHLDPQAHVYKAVLIDAQGNAIHRRNAQDIRAPLLVRTIGPGTADTVHYAFTVPAALAGRSLTIRARLLWRKFDRAYTEFAYRANPQGFQRFDDVPELPITEIAADQVTLRVAGTGEAAGGDTVALAEDWMRFNDYAIGLLLQGDTRGAAAGFDFVRRVAPDRIDGHRNLARVAIQDGNIPLVLEHLRACEELRPNDPQTAWFWGVGLQEDGRYVEAAAAYRRVLEAFPNDRAAWRNLGRTLYLNGEYADALEALDQVLRIDPEDRSAHYHKMLCYRALGRSEDALVTADAYQTYQIDESAQQFTKTYRLANPGVNREAQLVHVHDLRGVDEALAAAPSSEPVVP